MRYVLVLLAIGGCDGPMFSTPDEQRTQQAIAIVWSTMHPIYKTQAMTPPTIVWRTTSWDIGGDAVDGALETATETATIMWEGNYHRSALAHECYHLILWKTYGDGDTGHVGRGWTTIEPEAEASIAAAGL